MTKLCARGKAAAKSKFKVYPSAYANAYASKICAGKAKDPSGVRRKDWGPKKAKEGGDIMVPKKKQEKPQGYIISDQRGMQLHYEPKPRYKNGAMVTDNAKASRPRMTTETNQEYEKRSEYNGSYIKSELAGGEKVSNKSYESYYKDLI
jgi:hypothetical protein